jgi:hypothetical protein
MTVGSNHVVGKDDRLILKKTHVILLQGATNTEAVGKG